jgi:hypothetical protein
MPFKPKLSIALSLPYILTTVMTTKTVIHIIQAYTFMILYHKTMIHAYQTWVKEAYQYLESLSDLPEPILDTSLQSLMTFIVQLAIQDTQSDVMYTHLSYQTGKST